MYVCSHVHDRPSFRSFSVVRKLLLAIFTPEGHTTTANVDNNVNHDDINVDVNVVGDVNVDIDIEIEAWAL